MNAKRSFTLVFESLYSASMHAIRADLCITKLATVKTGWLLSITITSLFLYLYLWRETSSNTEQSLIQLVLSILVSETLHISWSCFEGNKSAPFNIRRWIFRGRVNLIVNINYDIDAARVLFFFMIIEFSDECAFVVGKPNDEIDGCVFTFHQPASVKILEPNGLVLLSWIGL